MESQVSLVDFNQKHSLTEISMIERPVLTDISIVIPTLGRPIMEQCLYWILVGDAWPGSLVVVDQGASHDVKKWLDCFNSFGIHAHHIISNQRGRSAGINRGLEQVDTRFVAITDDDCFVTSNWLVNMHKRLKQEPGVIFTGRVNQAGDDKVAFSTVTSDQHKRFDRPQLKVHPFIGGNAGLAMDVVRRIGFFDEHPCLQSAEDSDYGYRALRQGIPIAYDPGIVLVHYHWRNEAQRLARYQDYARSQGGFYGTHLRWGSWIIWQQVLRDLARGPIRWLRGLIKHDQDMIDRGRADTLHMLPGIVAGLKREDRPRKTQKRKRTT
jgi:GT2 family glycosyltransferase